MKKRTYHWVKGSKTLGYFSFILNACDKESELEDFISRIYKKVDVNTLEQIDPSIYKTIIHISEFI